MIRPTYNTPHQYHRNMNAFHCSDNNSIKATARKQEEEHEKEANEEEEEEKQNQKEEEEKQNEKEEEEDRDVTSEQT